MEDSVLCKIEELRAKIEENVAVNDDIVCAICEALIALAREHGDLDSIAFGYVWQADHYFYVKSDVKETAKALDCAQVYIDTKKPSQLLEKFYTLKHLLCEDAHDFNDALQFTLKALEIAEKLDIHHRVGANYGNVGAYFLEYQCYGEALRYTEQALSILRKLPETKPRILRLLLSNLVLIYFKLELPELIQTNMELLCALPIEEKDLKIYVDRGYMLYYAGIRDEGKCLYYMQEMFDDGLMTLSNRMFIIEFLINALETMMRIGNQNKAQELLTCLQGMMKENDVEPMLNLCRLQIEYTQQFGTEEEQRQNYRAYYTLYERAQSKINQLKAEGLRAKLELDELCLQYNLSMSEIRQLHTQANFDELTNTFNRRYLKMREDEIINSKSNPLVGFLFFDIDYFKEYNDHYGHLAGDTVLKTVAECLLRHAGKQLEVFRFGGDEFVCLSLDMDCAALTDYIEKVLTTLREQHLTHKMSRCAEEVTLSIGYGSKPILTKVELLTLFDEVDKALYIAKNEGRNRAKSI